MPFRIINITNKQFRGILNSHYTGYYGHKSRGGTRQSGFGNKIRGYGDYLWFQDRDMFYDMLRRYNNGDLLPKWRKE